MTKTLIAPTDPQGQRFAYATLMRACYYLERLDGDAKNLCVYLAILVKYGKLELERFSWDD